MQANINGKSVSYTKHGEGQPVVLLHGFAEHAGVWDTMIPMLKNMQLLIPDLPGSGKSDPDNSGMLIDDYAVTVNELLKHEKIDKCILIGHSMGGYIALAFAEKFKNKLSGFGLFHSSAFADNDEKKGVRKKGIEFIKEHGPVPFLKTTITGLFSEKTKKSSPALVESHIKASSNFTPGALISYYEAMMKRPDRIEVLKQADVPVLFILGTEDKAVTLEDGLKQCHIPEISHITILDELGHLGMLEAPEKCAESLNTFILMCNK